jgi:hypothetical protein
MCRKATELITAVGSDGLGCGTDLADPDALREDIGREGEDPEGWVPSGAERGSFKEPCMVIQLGEVQIGGG